MNPMIKSQMRSLLFKFLYYGAGVLLVPVLLMLAGLLGYALLGVENVRPVNIYRGLLAQMVLVAYSLAVTAAYLRKLMEEGSVGKDL
jgi:hypothetical protein